MSVPILCYHKVGPVEQEGRWLNVEQSLLRSHIRFFRRRGFKSVLARDLPAALSTRAFCLTFDDAYVSALTYGMEVLISEGAAATFYVVPSCVGGGSAWDGDRAAPLADWDSLLGAQVQGMELGNHTMTHARLSAVSADQGADEISLAQEALVARGVEVSTFCYPYGDVGSVSSLPLGYSACLALGGRPARAADLLHALPRLPVAYSDGIAKLLYRLYVRPLLRR